ncbi:MAG: DUF721 domain-containing protein [Selenomonadaceae bacterium]|nr:DUF721 domain-containing protein [Selenomonadaceae bacterium]
MFSTAEQTLKSSLKALGKDFYINYLRHALFFNWRSIVGDGIADNIRPSRLERKTLFVAIDSAPWRTEFQFKKAGIVDKINDAAECKLIDEILIGQSFKAPAPPSNDTNEPERLTPDEIIANDLPNITLTDEELEEILNNSPSIEDDQLRTVMLETSKTRARLNKCRLKHGWHRCATCELLVPPEEILCDNCMLKELEQFRRAIADVIREVPWLTYAEIRREMENRMPHLVNQCYPETVLSIRSTVVQQLARSLDVRDQRQIKRLVMAYRQLPPDQLTDDVIKRTMRRLRFDLPTGGEDY